MFQLENHTDKLSNVNLRAELHGEETKVAVDPSLKSSLYAAPSAEDQLKQELAGMDEDEE